MKPTAITTDNVGDVQEIEIEAIPERRAPLILDCGDDVVIAALSDGKIRIADAFNHIILSRDVVAQLRAFLGKASGKDAQ